MPRTVPGLLATGCALALLAGCSSGHRTEEAGRPTSAPTSAPPISSPAAPGTPSASTAPSQASSPVPGRVQKLVTLVVENKTFAQMRAQMPWTAQLADRYGYTTDYAALTHPSLPNYLAIAGGSLFGVTDDAAPTSHRISGPSIFGRALASGTTATLYADGMPGRCELQPDGRYAVKHNPWAYFVDEREACAQHDVPLDQLSGDIASGRLPAVGMVIPDLCNDAHDCPLSVADGWLRRVVGPMLKGPDWRAGRLAIVITADEDDRTDNNHILTVVAHPSLRHAIVRKPLTHYSLSRAYAEVGGFAPLGASRSTVSLLAAFGLTS